ncbi:MAG: hypothetical protein ACE5F1_02310 [Planctomycetota bacterium]
MSSQSRILGEQQWSELRGLGFVPHGSPACPAGSCLELGPFHFQAGASWAVLSRAARRGSASLLGRPGLWREDRRGRRVFDFPPQVFCNADPPEASDKASGLARLVKWALDTAEGELPSGWQAPAELAEPPPESLTVKSGSLPCQGSLLRETSRLALRFTLVELPPDLPAQRLSWLDHVLLDARQWRLLRLGIENSFVRAEADLTGAPLDLIEPLLGVSLEALRSSVEWLLLPVSVLADPSVECQALGRTAP